MSQSAAHPAETRLGRRDFEKLAALVEASTGIQMPPTKHTMLEGRLRRRLRALGMAGFDQYNRYLFDEGGLAEELTSLIDIVTTNKTEFFREPKSFAILVERALPDLVARGIGVERPLRAWSAGCSIGAEPYTLAMVLADAGATRPGFQYRVLGTDVCTDVLATAKKAIYPEEMAGPIPPDARRRHLLRSVDRSAQLVRVAPELRGLVEFSRLNFMDADYGFRIAHDIVFCRNVIIYFNTEVRRTVLGRICSYLRPGGYLFMGHSETITGIELPVRQVAPTVYVRL